MTTFANPNPPALLSPSGPAVPSAQLEPAPPTRASAYAKLPTAAKLLRFIHHSRNSKNSPVKHLRDFYRFAEEQTAGPWWKTMQPLGTRAAKDRRPKNPLGEMVRTYHPHLMGDMLKPLVEPTGVGDRGSAKMLEMKLNQWADDAKYAKEDEKRVLSSLLCAGVTYISRREGGQAVATEASTLDLGQPSVLFIPLDRLVVGEDEQDWDEADMGHVYPVDRQALLAANIGNETLLNDLPNIWERHADLDSLRQEFGGGGGEDAHLRDLVYLYEFCFSFQGRRFCCTLPPTQGRDEFVVEPYELVGEPEGSRYNVTALNTLPGHLNPISPAMVMMDAHLAQTGIVAKMMEQVENLERKYVGEPGAQDSILRLKEKGSDKFIIGKGKIQEFIVGGLVKEAVEALALFEGMGAKIGPNVEQQGGREDPSNTATGASILAGNAAVAMGSWKRQIDQARTKDLRRVAALLLQGGDEQTFMFTTSTGQQVPLVWTPGNIDLSWQQFRFKVKPTSAAGGMDARAKLRSLFEVGSMLPPFMQFFCGMLKADPAKVMRVVSDLSEMPELDEILPSNDTQGLMAQMFQMLAQNGQATPGGGAGGSPPQLGSGPMTKVGQMNSDVSRRIPA